MNLYQFCLNYLKNQTIERFPDFNTDELALYYLTPPIYHRYNITNITKNNMMKFLFDLLSSNKYSHIDKRYIDEEVLNAYLNDYDPDYISILDSHALFKIFKTFSDHPDARYFCDFNERLWESFAMNIISAAKYLAKHFKDFNSYMDYINSDPEAAMKDILEIRGFGVFTATVYFTTIGCYKFWQPHPLYAYQFIELFSKVDSNVVDYTTLIKLLNEQAEVGGVSSYTLYQIIRLIIKPNYSYHKCSMKNTKKHDFEKIFQDALIEAINNKTVIM